MAGYDDTVVLTQQRQQYRTAQQLNRPLQLTLPHTILRRESLQHPRDPDAETTDADNIDGTRIGACILEECKRNGSVGGQRKER